MQRLRKLALGAYLKLTFRVRRLYSRLLQRSVSPHPDGHHHTPVKYVAAHVCTSKLPGQISSSPHASMTAERH